MPVSAVAIVTHICKTLVNVSATEWPCVAISTRAREGSIGVITGAAIHARVGAGLALVDVI